MSQEFEHKSVLLNEVIDILKPAKGESLLDVTIGLGGHAKEVLSMTGSKGSLIALDADIQNLEEAQRRLSKVKGAKEFVCTNFINLPEMDIEPVDMILADLGMSSVHIDNPDRGFSYRTDAPLDLRYDRNNGETAHEIIERVSEEEINNYLWRYGELKQARRIAAAIKEALPKTTWQLRDAVETAIGYKANSALPQVFQSLRIVVNSELDALESLLQSGPKLLKEGGRMVVISFHSLEDRMVKHAFRAISTPKRDQTTGQISVPAPFDVLTKKPVTASDLECEENSRARSAKLRAIIRV